MFILRILRIFFFKNNYSAIVGVLIEALLAVGVCMVRLSLFLVDIVLANRPGNMTKIR